MYHFQDFPGIRWCDVKELVNEKNFCTLISFVALVRRKRPEKWRANRCFLIHNNAPAHRSVLVNDFSAKNKATTLDQCPYFCLFPRLKSALKGGIFDATDITKNANGRAENAFTKRLQRCFQQVYSS